jgi:DmsE family decaheme c-type cytochrome
MAGSEPGLCYQCHGEQRAAFAMPYHHPIEREFMKCSSCHQPHGSHTLRQVRMRGTEAMCGSCHEETQGPFIFEHPPGRVTGCQSCHQPHGSANPKMLMRAQVRFLCLECHNSTPVFHDLSKPRYQNCTVCHRKVHGSNLSRKLFE